MKAPTTKQVLIVAAGATVIGALLWFWYKRELSDFDPTDFIGSPD